MLDSIIIIFSLLITMQSIISIFLMIYGWEDPERILKDSPPEKFIKPKLSFSILLPARHEEEVIANTIQRIYNANYPKQLREIIVICKADDLGTIEVVQKKINQIENGKNNIKLVIFRGGATNKPNGLNHGLKISKKNVVCIFDAEDNVHSEIFNLINTEMIQKKVNIVQSGVQLMNYSSSWFSTFNVLEYFFWFKSSLHFFSKLGVIPLGGNTVFIKRNLMEKINGWDDSCLTEDADIGIRLSNMGEKVRVVYSDKYVTQEETPDSIKSLVKQRTRWQQGFLQILKKGDWLRYPKIWQKLAAFYILGYPFYQAILMLYIVISLLMIIFVKMSILATMISILPFYFILLQYAIQVFGLYEFTRVYELKFYWRHPIVMLFTFIPYQWILCFSSARAVIREVRGVNNWEKTTHIGAHRKKYATN